MANRKNTFLLKRSNIVNKSPSLGDIQLGELALNTADAKLFSTYTGGLTGATEIREIGWDRLSTISGGTVTGDVTFNDITVNTISATTYLNLPTSTDTFVTGFTYDDINTFTISQNGGLSDLTSTISVLSGVTYYGDGNGITNINYGNVNMGVLNVSEETFKDHFNQYQTAGIISGGTITDNGDGTIDISSVYGLIRATNTFLSDLLYFSAATVSGLSLVDNDTNFIYVDYNSGSPIITGTTDESILNYEDKIRIGRVWRTGIDVYPIEGGLNVTEFSKAVNERFNAEGDVVRTSGLIIGAPSLLTISSTSGVVYQGLEPTTVSALDTSVSDTFTYWYRDGIGGWTIVTGQTSLDNARFDDGDGTLGNITTNNYGNHWVYITFNGTLHVVYGRTNNPTLAQARLQQPPSDLPERLTNFSTFVGRYITRQGSTTIAETNSAFSTVFTPSQVTSHNSLANIEGGTSNEYYHLTLSNYNTLRGGSSDASLLHNHDSLYVKDGINSGGANEIFSGKSGTDLYFRTISGGTNTTVTTIGDIIKIDSTGGGSGDNFYVTGFTYNDANTFTLNRNDGVDLSASINNVTGLTINGTLDITGDLNVTGTTFYTNITGTSIGVDYIDFNNALAPLPSDLEGRIYWDDGNGSLTLGMHGGQVTQQIGLEHYYYVKNQSGATIDNGRVVRAAGTLGSSGRILGEYMIADGTIPAKFTLGVATENIINGDDGYVTEFGLVRGIDATGSLYGESWSGGTILYVSPTIPGGLTSVEPTAPDLKIEMAIVIDADANGSIFVRPSRYPHIYDLQEVNYSAGTENNLDILQWNESNLTWDKTNTPSFSGLTVYNNINHFGNYILDGDISQTGNYNVTGNTTQIGDTTTKGTVDIIGSGTGCTLSVTGKTCLDGNLEITGDVNVIGNLTYDGNLIITGATIITSGLTVTSGLTTDTLNISNTPTENNDLIQILGRNSSTGDVEYRDVKTIGNNITIVTGSTYSATTTDDVIGIDSSTNTVTLYLPDSVSSGRLRYDIKDIGVNSFVNPITVQTAGSDTIITTSVVSSFELSADGGAVILVNTGTGQWWQM